MFLAVDGKESGSGSVLVPGHLLMLHSGKISVGGVADCVERSQIFSPTVESFRGCIREFSINGSVKR